MRMKISDSSRPNIAKGQRLVHWCKEHMREVLYEGQLQVKFQHGI